MLRYRIPLSRFLLRSSIGNYLLSESLHRSCIRTNLFLRSRWCMHIHRPTCHRLHKRDRLCNHLLQPTHSWSQDHKARWFSKHHFGGWNLGDHCLRWNHYRFPHSRNIHTRSHSCPYRLHNTHGHIPCRLNLRIRSINLNHQCSHFRLYTTCWVRRMNGRIL